MRPNTLSLELTIPATDDFPLAASYRGSPAATSVVLVAPAVGVRRGLYDGFAGYLAAAGFGVLTWDWRGTGGSRPQGRRGLRGFRATMRNWAARDLGGAIAWASGRFPGARLLGVGHSFGGQAFGIADNADRVSALMTVAAQSGWWGHWPRPARYELAALWHVVVPALSNALGYFPGRALGLGEDLPQGVALEWARWCRNPEYFGDWRGHERFTAPLLSFAIADDPYAPAAAVAALHAHYGSPVRAFRSVRPEDLGLARIGHFGFFRPTARALWDESVTWLRAAGRATARAVPA
jgi:predicted alpha/beta hydrolase